MNEDLKKFADKLSDLVFFTQGEVGNLLKDENLKKEIADLNREQLKEGKRSDDSFLPDYSERSVSEFGKTPGPIKLHDTGDFYDSIEVKRIGLTEFELFSNPEKDGKFYEEPAQLRNYGEEIIGLSEANTELVAEKITQKVYNEIDRYLKQ